MDTKKEYQHPQSTCLGHLQGTMLNEIAMLEKIANHIDSDFYRKDEIIDAINQSRKSLYKSLKETNEVLLNHYNKINK